MIHSTLLEFPNNVIELMADYFDTIDSDVVVNRRPLNAMDNVQCIGVYPKKVEDVDSSMEIGRSFGPTLERWIIGIQVMVKDADEAQGARDHTMLMGLVEDLLYNNQALNLALSSTTALSLSGVRRRTQRRGVRNRNFLQGELAGDWYYLGTLEYYMETEKS